MTSQLGARIHTLDGWRGVAILLVIANHAASHSRFDRQLWTHLCTLGVDIFFVVSGYIITLRFLEERDKSSTIDLGSFYVRRVFRILPLVCAYLLTLVVLSRFIDLGDIRPSEILGSLFFFRNYQLAASPPHGLYTAHFWSLSIEEHFYLIWPAVLMWLGNRRAVWFAAIGAVACAIWRAYNLAHPVVWIRQILPNPDQFALQTRTDVRLDGLLLGCTVAILLAHPPVRNFISRNFPKETPLLLAVVLGLNVWRTYTQPTLSSYLLISAMLASTLVIEEGLAHKGLNWRPLIWIGTISYSAYIWQELFLTRPDASTFPLGPLCRPPLNLICVLAISSASFFFIERPCIALGKRLLARRRERTAAATSI
jgi:peptidoglycan/LPS O-acetylase OafA/YrhL